MSSQSRDISESRPLIAVLLIASMLTIMLDTVLSPALPGLRENFSNVENIDFLARIILTFPSIFVAVCAPIYGVLVDRVGRTRILYIATIIYGVGGGSGYVLESIPLLLASRALLGIGAAGVFVAATTLLTDYFVGDDRDYGPRLAGSSYRRWRHRLPHRRRIPRQYRLANTLPHLCFGAGVSSVHDHLDR